MKQIPMGTVKSANDATEFYYARDHQLVLRVTDAIFKRFHAIEEQERNQRGGRPS